MNTKMMQLLCLLSVVTSAVNLNGMKKDAPDNAKFITIKQLIKNRADKDNAARIDASAVKDEYNVKKVDDEDRNEAHRQAGRVPICRADIA